MQVLEQKIVKIQMIHTTRVSVFSKKEIAAAAPFCWRMSGHTTYQEIFIQHYTRFHMGINVEPMAFSSIQIHFQKKTKKGKKSSRKVSRGRNDGHKFS